MRPRDVVKIWIDAFNRSDANALAALYREDAINHQVAETAVSGREAIPEMFSAGFKMTEMVCILENLFEDSEWAIFEWRDPKGLPVADFFTSWMARSFFSAATGTSCRFSRTMA